MIRTIAACGPFSWESSPQDILAAQAISGTSKLSVRITNAMAYLLQKRISERLDAEFERAKIWRLIKPLHFFGHECLMDRFTLGICRVN